MYGMTDGCFYLFIYLFTRLFSSFFVSSPFERRQKNKRTSEVVNLCGSRISTHTFIPYHVTNAKSE